MANWPRVNVKRCHLFKFLGPIPLDDAYNVKRLHLHIFLIFTLMHTLFAFYIAYSEFWAHHTKVNRDILVAFIIANSVPPLVFSSIILYGHPILSEIMREIDKASYDEMASRQWDGFIILHTLICIILSFLDLYFYLQSPRDKVAFNLSTCVSFLLSTFSTQIFSNTFCGMIRLVSKQHGVLLRVLDDYSERPWTLGRAVRAHSMLCEATLRLQNVLQFGLLAIVSGGFFSMTCCMHAFITAFILDKAPFYAGGGIGTKILLSLFTSWMLISTCDENVKKSEQFPRLLFHRMMQNSSKSLLKKERFRLYIFRVKKVKFSACGLFHIDFSLLHSMVASATTYLMILLQFY